MRKLTNLAESKTKTPSLPVPPPEVPPAPRIHIHSILQSPSLRPLRHPSPKRPHPEPELSHQEKAPEESPVLTALKKEALAEGANPAAAELIARLAEVAAIRMFGRVREVLDDLDLDDGTDAKEITLSICGYFAPVKATASSAFPGRESSALRLWQLYTNSDLFRGRRPIAPQICTHDPSWTRAHSEAVVSD